jgi:hypothetical protein
MASTLNGWNRERSKKSTLWSCSRQNAGVHGTVVSVVLPIDNDCPASRARDMVQSCALPVEGALLEQPPTDRK